MADKAIEQFASQVGTDINKLIINIGTVNSLSTNNKSSLVAALNEVLELAHTARTSAESGLSASDLSALDHKYAPLNITVGEDNHQVAMSEAVKSLITQVAALPTTASVDEKIANASVTIGDSPKKIQELILEINQNLTSTTALANAAVTSTALEQRLVEFRNNLVNGAPEALDTLKEISDRLDQEGSATTAVVTGLNSRLRFDSDQVLTVEQQSQALKNLGIEGANSDLVKIYTNARDGVQAS